MCLELEQIGIDFQGKCLLKQISLRIEEQEIVSIIGPNGVGKTTLFNIISGQTPPTRGQVHFNGQNITGWPPHRICRAGISRTFQIARPFPEMTALENVLVGIWFGKKGEKGGQRSRHDALNLLALVGLTSKSDVQAKELTLSELRRLEVARALATQPRLLLLDEIAAGLSPQALQQSVELIKALRTRGLTLLIVDHYLSLTAKVSDRLIALYQGAIVTTGSPTEVLQSPEVIEAYLGESRQ